MKKLFLFLLFFQLSCNDLNDLQDAIYANDGGLVKQLLIKNGYTEKEKTDALSIALVNNNVRLVKLILKYLDINYIDEIGSTILDEMSAVNMSQYIQLFIDNEANINIQNASGETPLYTSLYNHQKKTALILLENGADPNISDNHDITPLHIAAYLDDRLLVKTLLEYGADPNAIDHSNQTPLYAASIIKTEGFAVEQILTNRKNLKDYDSLYIEERLILDDSYISIGAIKELLSDYRVSHTIIADKNPEQYLRARNLNIIADLISKRPTKEIERVLQATGLTFLALKQIDKSAMSEENLPQEIKLLMRRYGTTKLE